MVRKANPSRRRRPLLQSFFKVMFGDFAYKLLLPPAYAQRFRGILPREITLTTCDGKKKQVIMSQFENNLFFKAGWTDFVQDKSLNSDKLKRGKPKIMYGKDRADKFVPDRPFFKVCMKDSYIKQVGGAYLHIPTTFVNKYISRKVQNVTLRTTEESAWVARLSFDRRFVRMTTGWDEFEGQ